jgi:hypothetical protein
MFSNFFLIFVTLSLLQSAWTCAKGDDGVEFDMVLLKLMWPPSDCINVDQCHVPTNYNMFSIHVFAPAYANGTMLQGCSGPAFDLKPLHNARPALDVLWPDFFNDGKPEGFWKTKYVIKKDTIVHTHVLFVFCPPFSFSFSFCRLYLIHVMIPSLNG